MSRGKTTASRISNTYPVDMDIGSCVDQTCIVAARIKKRQASRKSCHEFERNGHEIDCRACKNGSGETILSQSGVT
eukprot:scaffold11927_cov23-Cyclotella_meneghiniana.AAC.1